MLRQLAVIVSCCALGACASISDPLEGNYAGYGIKPLSTDALSASNAVIKAARDAQGITEEEYRTCSASAGPDDSCRIRRNQLVAILVTSSEQQCMDHRRSMYGKEAGFNIAAGSFTNLFSGWATVAPGQHQKSILSALALLSNSERSLVNELVYKSVIVPAVDKKILQLREEKARKLFAHFPDPIGTYPIDVALHDTIDFHYACSFMTGLEKALAEGTQETTRQKAERLKRDLTLLQAQVDAYVPKDVNNVVYKNLTVRYDALSEEIKSLEKQ